MKMFMSGMAAVAVSLSAMAAQAQEAQYVLHVKQGGGFEPSTLSVPVDTKVKLVIQNDDKVEAEFESYPLNREEKIAPGDKTEIFVGPLQAGSYPFFDDNNEQAKGQIVAQ